MNPRAKQFGLGGTLHAWTRLTEAGLTATQRRILERVYRGRDPRVYSRYGVRQWRAALPSTRVVIKDPFALLSLPVIVELTNATPVVLFRHPGALAASYRRMGWTPAVAEIERLLGPRPEPATATSADTEQVSAMAWFWSRCYDAVLADTADLSPILFVDHAELTRGGDAALRRLMGRCGITADRPLSEGSTPDRMTALLRRRGAGEKPTLHNFDRTATDVVDAWRTTLSPSDALLVEQQTEGTWTRLRERRLPLEVVTTDTSLEPGEEHV